MNKVLLEYVWLDGYKTPNLRSKIKVINAHKDSGKPTGGWNGPHLTGTLMAPLRVRLLEIIPKEF